MLLNFHEDYLQNSLMEKRLRRLRNTAGLRALVEETSLEPRHLVYPMFVCDGQGIRRPISAMPGIHNFSVDELVRDVSTFAHTGLGGVLLFGIPDEKDAHGTTGCREDGVVQRAVSALKKEFPHLTLITDVCLCEYTSHGHCGILSESGEILNDETVMRLTEMAVSHARAGTDIIAPSDMMDLRVGAIRRGLDEAGFPNLPVMSYAVKYASAFYGPFREAAQSAPSFGDRRSHQLNPANFREALQEAQADVDEGADILMVKPAGYYLDLVRALRDRFDLPLAAYQVSGEYSMIKTAAAQGWVDGDRAAAESLMSIRRAGADIVISYFARAFALAASE